MQNFYTIRTSGRSCKVHSLPLMARTIIAVTTEYLGNKDGKDHIIIFGGRGGKTAFDVPCEHLHLWKVLFSELVVTGKLLCESLRIVFCCLIHWSVLPFVSLKSWNSGWCRVVLPPQFCCVQARKQKTHLFFISLWKVVGSAVAGVLCSSLGVPGITQLSYAIKLMLWAQLLCQIKQDKRKQLLVPSWR